MFGTNAKMTEFHAAMGLCNLRHVLEEIDKRKKAYVRKRKTLPIIMHISRFALTKRFLENREIR